MAIRGGEHKLKLLDTHAWIWAVERNPLLSREHVEVLEQNSNSIAISAVSLWEVSMLVAKGRLNLVLSLKDWFDIATFGFGISILPLTPDIAREAYELPGELHEDPADRMIVATARVHKCLLLTEDNTIQKYSHVHSA